MTNPIDWDRIARLQQAIGEDLEELGYALDAPQLLSLVKIVYEDPGDENDALALIRKTMAERDGPPPSRLLFIRVQHALARGLTNIRLLKFPVNLWGVKTR